jgi:hypothetical protein
MVKLITKAIRINEKNVCLPFPYYYRILVLAFPIDTSGETSFGKVGDAERASVWWFFMVFNKLNLWYYNLHTKN